MMQSNIYTIFGNPVRTKLIRCLADKPKNVTELIQTCGLSQSAVSQHLVKLKQSGIVAAEKKGKEVWYRLKYQRAAQISALLQTLEQEVV